MCNQIRKEQIMTDIHIQKISNGYTVYSVGETKYYKTKEEVLKAIKEML